MSAKITRFINHFMKCWCHFCLGRFFKKKTATVVGSKLHGIFWCWEIFSANFPRVFSPFHGSIIFSETTKGFLANGKVRASEPDKVRVGWLVGLLGPVKLHEGKLVPQNGGSSFESWARGGNPQLEGTKIGCYSFRTSKLWNLWEISGQLFVLRRTFFHNIFWRTVYPVYSMNFLFFCHLGPN